MRAGSTRSDLITRVEEEGAAVASKDGEFGMWHVSRLVHSSPNLSRLTGGERSFDQNTWLSSACRWDQRSSDLQAVLPGVPGRMMYL